LCRSGWFVIQIFIYHQIVGIIGETMDMSIIYTIGTGIIASILYALVGYAKETAKTGEDFDYYKAGRTVVIGAIIGVLVYLFGYTPTTANEYAPIVFTIIGGNVLVEKIIGAIKHKLKLTNTTTT